MVVIDSIFDILIILFSWFIIGQDSFSGDGGGVVLGDGGGYLSREDGRGGHGGVDAAADRGGGGVGNDVVLGDGGGYLSKEDGRGGRGGAADRDGGGGGNDVVLGDGGGYLSGGGGSDNEIFLAYKEEE